MSLDSPDQQDTQTPQDNPVLAAVARVANPVPMATPNPVQPTAPAQDQDEDEPNFAQKFFDEQKNILGAPQEAAKIISTPGGWAKSVLLALTGSQGTGSFGDKLSSAVGGFGQDAAAGMSRPAQAGPKGSGALQGIADTLAAHGQRVAQQKQQQFQNSIESQKAADEHAHVQAMIAHENIAMLHDQYLNTKLDVEQQERNVGIGKMTLQPYLDAKGQIIKEGIDGDEAKALVASGHLDPTQQHVFQTGFSSTKKNPNGTPAMTYTVVGNVPEVEIKDQKTADFLSQYTGQQITVGQKLPGVQYGTLSQQATSAQTAEEAINAQRRKNGMDEIAGKMSEEKLNMLPYWNQELAKAGGDPLRAMQFVQHDMQNNPDIAKKYPNAATNIMSMYGDPQKDPSGAKEWEIMRKDREQEQIAKKKEADLQADRLAKVGTPMAGVLTDEMKQKIGSLPADKQAVLKAAPAASQVALLETAFGPGSIDFDKTFPARLTAGASGLNAQQAIGVIKQLNPKFDVQQYKLTSKAYQAVTTGALGNQISQYNNVLQHGALAQDAIMEASGRSNNPKFLNTAINEAEKLGWGAEAAALSAGLTPVKEEFATLMANGYKPSEAEQQAYDQLFNPASTPGQIGAALKVIGSTGAVRLAGINQQYQRVAGQNIPGILTKESMDAAVHMNLDPATMARLRSMNTGAQTLFANPQWQSATPAQIQEQRDQSVAAQAANNMAAGKAAPAATPTTAPKQNPFRPQVNQ
jgi:hypothetical protein